jgi:hypothetical protein
VGADGRLHRLGATIYGAVDRIAYGPDGALYAGGAHAIWRIGPEETSDGLLHLAPGGLTDELGPAARGDRGARRRRARPQGRPHETILTAGCAGCAAIAAASSRPADARRRREVACVHERRAARA